MYNSPRRIYGGRLCSQFKKTKYPKCDEQEGCIWIKPHGQRGRCKSMDIQHTPRGEVPRGEVPRGEVLRGEVLRGEVLRGEVPRGEVLRGEVPRGEVPRGTCRLFKKTKHPRCDDHNWCIWVKQQGKKGTCLERQDQPVFSPRVQPVARLVKNCRIYKKTINPKCDDQEGCHWIKKSGCVNIEGRAVPQRHGDERHGDGGLRPDDGPRPDDGGPRPGDGPRPVDGPRPDNGPRPDDGPRLVAIPKNEFDKIDVMKYKELRPREVLRDPSKLNKYRGWYMSEKIDGWQALWDGRGILYTKSYKRTFAVPKEWLSLLPPIPLAGEIKIKGMPATTVASLQTNSPLWRDAEFFIFDLPGPKFRILPFRTRYENIIRIVRESCMEIHNCPLLVSHQILIENTEQLLHQYEEIIEHGGEGLVLTNPGSIYQLDGKRSSERVKLKGRNDSEGIVVGYNLGGRIGIMKSLEIDFEGIIFSLGIGFNKEQRDNYERLFPIETVIKFSYRGLSINGKPKEARFLEVRIDF